VSQRRKKYTGISSGLLSFHKHFFDLVFKADTRKMRPRKTRVSSFGSGSQGRSPTACGCCGPPTSRHTSRRWGSRSSPRTLATRPLTGRGRCGRGGGEGSVGGCVGGWIRSQQAEMCPKIWRVVSACSQRGYIGMSPPSAGALQCPRAGGDARHLDAALLHSGRGARRCHSGGGEWKSSTEGQQRDPCPMPDQLRFFLTSD